MPRDYTYYYSDEGEHLDFLRRSGLRPAITTCGKHIAGLNREDEGCYAGRLGAALSPESNADRR